ncbi:MAG: PIG-L family deacetylase [Acidobacteriota bacterium]
MVRSFFVFLTVLVLSSNPTAGQSEAVRAAHDYGFDLRSATTWEVDLTREGFTWPAVPSDVDTVLLEIELRSRSPRKALPSIQALAEEEIVQHVEREARGRRYLNLSALAANGWPAAGSEVQLDGWKVSWQPQVAKLRGFATPAVAGRRTLILAPHPDDAEIAAFGLYASTDADVVTVTAGDAGGMNFRSLYPEASSHYRVKGWIRTLDSLLVPRLGGVSAPRARNLGYYDATLHRLYEQPTEFIEAPYAELPSPGWFRTLNADPDLAGKPFSGTWRGLVGDMKDELERVRPEIVVLPHPQLDAHRDHQYTSIAFLEALATTDFEPTLFFYTNHAVGAEVYPYGPRQATASLPPWLGETLPFDSVYSFPLDEEMQSKKLFALEAMHDLRPFRIEGAPGAGESFRAWKRAVGRRFRAHRESYSYYRRAARPNELFLVADRESGLEVLDVFLEGRER